jgi:catechol 2,3-dioxygenase-like lactoylglutathione lyase family enzyme
VISARSEASVTIEVEHAIPILPSRNLQETLEFYARLGFENRGAPPEEGNYLVIGRGGVELHFVGAPETNPFTTSASCYIRTVDADALYEEWRQAGIIDDPATGSRLVPPHETEHGMREFALIDPSGNLIRVGSPSPL